MAMPLRDFTQFISVYLVNVEQWQEAADPQT